MPTPRLPRPGRYILRFEPRRRPLARTCAPRSLPVCWRSHGDTMITMAASAAFWGVCCDAPRPAGCHGTDWPPLTSWERYAAERREGMRVPPSVSVWREQDVRRQAAAEREARSQAPEQPAEPRVVAWGPSCEDERPAHRIGVRS